MKPATAALVALAVGILSSATARAQIDNIIPTCEACHGPDGISQISDVPTIAGISALVIEDALYAYREGDRQCGTDGGSQLNMCAPAQTLDESLIGAIADHYAGLTFAAVAQDVDAARAAQGKSIHERDCEICHIQGGSDPSDDTSILAGQHMDYLRHALTEYRAGERPQPRAMEARMSPLSDADIDALVHYYASAQ